MAFRDLIKPGDYVDVRAVAVAVDGRTVKVRVPGTAALHQIPVDAAVIQRVESRSAEAIAADAVCATYGEHGLQDRMARDIARR